MLHRVYFGSSTHGAGADHANEKRWCRSRKICDRIALYKDSGGILE